MTASSHRLGHPIYWDGERWRNYYTPEHSGSGQFEVCIKCKKPATEEGHDGCLGTLPENIVMNACCGHGQDSAAYVQYWDGSCIRGESAIAEQSRLKAMCPETEEQPPEQESSHADD